MELENLSDASVYTILTIPKKVTEMSANLKAPIIINNKNKLARQIVLQDSKLEVKYEMYADLKKSIMNFDSDDSTRTTAKITTDFKQSEEDSKAPETPPQERLKKPSPHLNH